MGQKIVLTENFTDTSLPKIYEDPGMSEGTLFLLDPGHSKGVFAGVADATVIPNIARDVAAGIMGVSASATDGLSGALIVGPTEIKIERTSKGGIHVLPSQVNQTGTNRWYVPWPAALKQYLFDNSELTAFYFSVCLRVTRVGLTQTAAAAPMVYAATPASGTYLVHMQNLTGGPPTGSKLLGRYVSPGLAAGGVNGLIAVGVNGWTGTRPGDASGVVSTSGLVGGGAIGGFGSGINKNAGWVIYRVKVEDLSKTKRANGGLGGTLAEEYALALAQDQADLVAAFAVGGKFYGDTIPTDPASFP